MTITANTIQRLVENKAWDDTNAIVERLVDQWKKRLSVFDISVDKQITKTEFKIITPIGKTDYLPYQKHIRLLKKYAKEFFTFFNGLDVEIEIRNKNVVPPVVINIYYEDRLDASIWRDWNNPLQWCTLRMELSYLYNNITRKSDVEVRIQLRPDLFLRHMERSLMAHSLDDVSIKVANDISTKYYTVMMDLLERVVKAVRLTSIELK